MKILESNRKYKGFTLTELLVVVVIVSVLAMVVLPKFNKVIEGRRTSEAENVMAAIRTEQEARCALGKNYAGPAETDKLASIPSNTGTNYEYNLETTGINATSINGGYMLNMPSYADGRICCEDVSAGACDKLNKSYPSCESLLSQTDFVDSNSDCAADVHLTQTDIPGIWDCEEPAEGKAPRIVVNAKGCKEITTYKWLGGPVCDFVEDKATEVCECSTGEGHSEGEIFEKSGEHCACGAPKYKWHCGEDTKYAWVSTLETPCVSKPDDKPGDECEGQTCPYECDTATGTWKLGACSECACKSNEQDVDACKNPQQTLVWNFSHGDGWEEPIYDVDPGRWDSSNCKCICPPKDITGLQRKGRYFLDSYGSCKFQCDSYDYAQAKEICERGSSEKQRTGEAVPGYWNADICACLCPKKWGISPDGYGGCYFPKCDKRTPKYGSWVEDKKSCELVGKWKQCSDGSYVSTQPGSIYYGSCPGNLYRGQWNDAKCKCNCPSGTRVTYNVTDRGAVVYSGQFAPIPKCMVYRPGRVGITGGGSEYEDYPDWDEQPELEQGWGYWGDDYHEDDSWLEVY